MKEELLINYWRTIARTRSSGRVAQSVKDRVQESWKRFDDDVIVQALQTHIDRYQGYKETYTIGIMRNMQKSKNEGRRIGAATNQFNQGIQQQQYGDMSELEKELLAN